MTTDYETLFAAFFDEAADCAGAIAPIVTGAGGFIGDWNLKPVGMDFDGHLVAASSRGLAEEAVRILGEK